MKRIAAKRVPGNLRASQPDPSQQYRDLRVSTYSMRPAVWSPKTITARLQRTIEEMGKTSAGVKPAPEATLGSLRLERSDFGKLLRSLRGNDYDQLTREFAADDFENLRISEISFLAHLLSLEFRDASTMLNAHWTYHGPPDPLTPRYLKLNFKTAAWAPLAVRTISLLEDEHILDFSLFSGQPKTIFIEIQFLRVSGIPYCAVPRTADLLGTNPVQKMKVRYFLEPAEELGNFQYPLSREMLPPLPNLDRFDPQTADLEKAWSERIQTYVMIRSTRGKEHPGEVQILGEDLACIQEKLGNVTLAQSLRRRVYI